MNKDLDRLTRELPAGWSWTVTRSTPDDPRIYAAYSSHQDLSTRPFYDVEDVIEEARQKQTVHDDGRQLTLFTA